MAERRWIGPDLVEISYDAADKVEQVVNLVPITGDLITNMRGPDNLPRPREPRKNSGYDQAGIPVAFLDRSAQEHNLELLWWQALSWRMRVRR